MHLFFIQTRFVTNSTTKGQVIVYQAQIEVKL